MYTNLRSPREGLFTQLLSQPKVTSISKISPTSDFQTDVVVGIYAGAYWIIGSLDVKNIKGGTSYRCIDLDQNIDKNR